MATEYPVRLFKTEAAWHKWLEKNQAGMGVWLKMAKKNSGASSISYLRAVDGALSYGWIDSQIKKWDEQYYVIKFTPRRRGSHWTPANQKRATELINLGLMKPAGQAAVDLAKTSGRWISPPAP